MSNGLEWTRGEDGVAGWKSESDGVSTASETLIANRASGFVASHVFDLEHVASFAIKTTVIASAADSETWGTAPGDIAMDVEAYSTSDDGVVWKQISTATWYADEVGGPDVASFRVAFVTARYVKVENLRIIDSDFAVYSGPHNPSLTVRFDVSYV